MISCHLNKKNNLINDTLLVFFNDNPKPSLLDIKYDCLNLFNPKPNPWFFYHIEDYLEEIKKRRDNYSNVLLFGGSKGGSASIVISNLLQKEKIFNNVFSWSFSPVLNLEFGNSIKAEHKFVSALWEQIKEDEKIKNKINQFGKIYSFIDCSFSLLYSYSYHECWLFDKDNFNLVTNRSCVIEDYVVCGEKLMKFDPRKKPFQNIHNVFGYYWKVERDLFYYKLEKFIIENSK